LDVRRIAHISDLHFGAVDPLVAESLIVDLDQARPDLVAVSGDLTQRARAGQFRAARHFLRRIEAPKLVVPGNHDIPLYNVVARLFWPLDGYARYFDSEPAPTFVDDELAVVGISTARSNTWKDGRISAAQVERLVGFFEMQQERVTKILVAHHPFIPPVADPTAALVGGADEALRALEACGCRLILSGHLHQAYAGGSRPHHVESEKSILVVQAGTAISHRRRDEANAYNLLTIDAESLELEVRTWNGQAFVAKGVERFAYEPTGWEVCTT